jgi:hypothetical protein
MDDAAAPSPEPLDLLVASLPPRALLGLLKADKELSRIVFQGFAVREQALGRGVVRQRLAHELERDPMLAASLFALWRDAYAPLAGLVDDPDFVLDAPVIQGLAAQFGTDATRYALLHAPSDAAHEWADRVAELRAEALAEIDPICDGHDAAVTRLQGSLAELRDLVHDTRETLKAVEHERDGLRKDVTRLERALADGDARAEKLRHDVAAAKAEAEDRLAREQRRARKAEEEAAVLRKAVSKQAAAPQTAPAPLHGDAAVVIREALALLQQGLDFVETPQPPAKPVAPPPAPDAPTPRPARRPPGAALTLPGAHGKRALPLTQVADALVRNHETLIAEVRDGLARMQPAREREALTALAAAGIPDTVLTGPLRPAVLDGSNVANMSAERRAHLAYLGEARRAAWAEGYFPVLIVVDASLRHQIDQPDALMAAVERGEITMAQPGTSADEVLIDEAQRRGAVILTNDRLADWPAAKGLEKRHVVLRNGKAGLGNFHRSTNWFGL